MNRNSTSPYMSWGFYLENIIWACLVSIVLFAVPFCIAWWELSFQSAFTLSIWMIKLAIIFCFVMAAKLESCVIDITLKQHATFRNSAVWNSVWNWVCYLDISFSVITYTWIEFSFESFVFLAALCLVKIGEIAYKLFS